MGRFTSFGTRIAVNLSSGVVASAMCVIVFVATKGSLASFFSVMLSLTISSTAVGYIAIFPALVILRRRYPDAPRPYRVPGGTAGAWAGSMAAMIALGLVFWVLGERKRKAGLTGISIAVEPADRPSRTR